MLYTKDFSALMNMNAKGKLGKVQTLSLSANYASGTATKESLKDDLARLTILAGGNIDNISVVASKKHFPHAIVTLYMKNDALVRYSFTEMNVTGRKEWGVYATDAEVYTNEGSNHIALKIPVADIKADEYTVDEWAEEIEKIALSDADSKCLDNIVNQIL
jgi:hypothetical protein